MSHIEIRLRAAVLNQAIADGRLTVKLALQELYHGLTSDILSFEEYDAILELVRNSRVATLASLVS